MTEVSELSQSQLTDDQIAALNNYLSVERAFYGISIDTGIRIFTEINEKKKIDPQAGHDREQKWFKNLGYTASN